MIADELKKVIAEAAGIDVAEVELEHPADLSHGDYSTNIALKQSKKIGQSPTELAQQFVRYIVQHKPRTIEKIEMAGPGFINFRLSPDFFTGIIAEIQKQGERWGANKTLGGQRVMVEYTDPNPFKEFHIGHLMSNAIGEAISRLVEFSGADVKRANYQGDVGLHVAQAIWGKQQKPELPWGDAYAYGSSNYDKNQSDIDALNKKIYERSDEEVNKLYDAGRKDSIEHFEKLYGVLGTKFDHYFFESEEAESGKKLVEEHKDIFEESDGATIFRGEKYDPKLHTRVFVSSEGLPIYEAKELSLAKKKFETWDHDLSIVVTANEIADYYRVVMKALEQFEPELASKIQHVAHGFLKLPTGKMSSRTGDVITAAGLIEEVNEKVLEKMNESDVEDKESVAEQVAVAAIKYSILKQTAGKDIVFDMEKSLSFEGDSGPYLQYSYTRARSVLQKAKSEGIKTTHLEARLPSGWVVNEIERLLYRFPEVVERACEEYEPHYVVTYLTQLAGAFNSWYAKEKIVEDSPEAPYKVALTAAFAETLRNGLWLLGIRAPERM